MLLSRAYVSIPLLLGSIMTIALASSACNKKDSNSKSSEFQNVGNTAPILLEYTANFNSNELTLAQGSSNELEPDGFAKSDAKISAAMRSGCAYNIPAGTYKITSEKQVITSIVGLDPRPKNPDPKRVISFAGSGKVELSGSADERFVLDISITSSALVVSCAYEKR